MRFSLKGKDKLLITFRLINEFNIGEINPPKYSIRENQEPAVYIYMKSRTKVDN